MPVNLNHRHELESVNRIRFLCISKYIGSKNPKMVLEAFLANCVEHDNISLTLCGFGDEKSDYFKGIKRMIQESEYCDRVRLMINTSLMDTHKLYQNHEVFVMASAHDPAAVSNLEAMAFGLPVICSEKNGTANYTRHGKSGYLFDISSFSHLCEYMNEMIKNPEQIKRMGIEAIKDVRNYHSPSNVCKSLITTLMS